MKCPKCGYLGFEHVERCRNCGYDFLLSRSVGSPDLSIRESVQEPSPLEDLELVDRTRRVDTGTFVTEMDQDLDRILGATAPLSIEPSAAVPALALAPPQPMPVAAAPVRTAPVSSAPAQAPSQVGAKLPLFSSGADDAPLITKASPPRPPLAVRRATPEIARLRAERSRTPSMDLPLDPAQAEPTGAAPHAAVPSGEGDIASPAARATAAAIDLFILATIDAAVIYFTMQICAVSLSELAIVPKVPLLAFLLVQNGGYLVAFTVGGQTLGKMAAGIKVVASDSDANPDIGHAFLRTLLWLVLAVPAGLGFVTALFSRDHRGLHDRFAGTRVVRASA